MDRIVLFPIPIADLISEIAKAVREEVVSSQQGATAEHDDLLSREEAAKLLRITLPTLRQRTKEGRLRGYRMGARVLYRRSEVLQSLTVR
jgi:excisionase family DNA binding protein